MEVDYKACVKEYVKYKAEKTGFEIFDTTEGVPEDKFRHIWERLKATGAEGSAESCIYCLGFKQASCTVCPWGQRYGYCRQVKSAFEAIRGHSKYFEFIMVSHSDKLKEIEERFRLLPQLTAEDLELVQYDDVIALKAKTGKGRYILAIRDGKIYRYHDCRVPGIQTESNRRIIIGDREEE